MQGHTHPTPPRPARSLLEGPARRTHDVRHVCTWYQPCGALRARLQTRRAWGSCLAVVPSGLILSGTLSVLVPGYTLAERSQGTNVYACLDRSDLGPGCTISAATFDVDGGLNRSLSTGIQLQTVPRSDHQTVHDGASAC